MDSIKNQTRDDLPTEPDNQLELEFGDNLDDLKTVHRIINRIDESLKVRERVNND